MLLGEVLEHGDDVSRHGAGVPLMGASAGPDGTERPEVLASSSIDNESGSSLGGVLGVASAEASARPDGTGPTEVLPSSSIDNASESSSVVLDSDFADAEEGRGHGTAVPLAEALTGPDGTAAKKQRKRVRRKGKNERRIERDKARHQGGEPG